MRLSELAPGSLIMCLLPRVADLRNRNIQYTHKRKGYSQGKMADFVKLTKEWLILLSWLQNGWFCWGDYKMVDFVEMTKKWFILLNWLQITWQRWAIWHFTLNPIETSTKMRFVFIVLLCAVFVFVVLLCVCPPAWQVLVTNNASSFHCAATDLRRKQYCYIAIIAILQYCNRPKKETILP